MATHGHTTTWGMHLGVGRATDAKRWYARFKTWLAARHTARLATLSAQWDVRRESVRSFRADAAIDMVPSAHLDATTRALCDLSL